MRYLSICSGIEAATVAWHPLGWECAGVAEIEPFPCQVLAQRLGAGRPRYMPDPEAEGLSAKDAKARAAAIKAMDGRHMRWGNQLTNFGDFTQIRDDDVGPIDLLVGGTPCQSFSVAGKRLGLDDARGNLTLEFLALAKRVRPRWLVWENVPGVLSHDDGRTFGTFLGLLAECGFERWAYRVLDAQYVRVDRFGRAVPQRRRRVFVVGYSGTAPIHPRAVLFDRESLRGNPAPRREAGQGVATAVAPSLTGSGRGVERPGETRGQDPVVAVDNWPADVAPTLNAAFGSKLGLEDQHIRGGVASSCPPISLCLNAGAMGRIDAESETLIPANRCGFDDDVAHSLRAEGFDASEDETGRGTPLVLVHVPPEVAGTLKACAGDSGTPNGAEEADRLVPVQQPYSITPSNSNEDYNAREVGRAQALTAGGNRPSARGGDIIAFDVLASGNTGHAASEEVVGALRGGGKSGGRSAVAYAIQERAVSESLENGPGGKGYQPDHAYTLEARNKVQAVAARWGVRRLMPIECERLQGFPDRWTEIEWRGKPADLCPDGPRYKACGNSKAINVVTWLGERIAAVDAIAEAESKAA